MKKLLIAALILLSIQAFSQSNNRVRTSVGVQIISISDTAQLQAYMQQTAMEQPQAEMDYTLNLPGSSKNSVLNLLGSPDKVNRLNNDKEKWEYPDFNIYFKNGLVDVVVKLKQITASTKAGYGLL